jgi:trimeric autotransporter adhesin
MSGRLRWWVLLASLASGVLAAQSINYSYDAAGRLVGAAYPGGNVLTYSYDHAGNLVRSLVASSVSGPAPAITAAGVLNSASFIGGAVAPGEIIVIYGSGLGPATLVTENVTPLGTFDNYLSQTSVTFDGVPAALIYASAGQTAVAVPYSVAGRASTQLVVQYQGRSSNSITLPVTNAAPGLFSANSSGTGNGSILNQDTTINSPANPAAKGSEIVLYGTGEGQTSPPGVDGKIAAGVYPAPLLPVTVSIGGINVTPEYAGAAPTLVAGVIQVNVKIPGSVPSGAVPVVLTVGNVSSQAGLTVAVQ